MNTNISPEEKLYRALLFSNPNAWDDEKGRPSSALFKDSKGVSVDRDGKRSEYDIVNSFSERFSPKNLKAIVFIGADFCYELPLKLIYRPEPNNIYHAEIHDSDEKVQITSKGKLRKLAKNCVVIEIDK
ncbi:hypothetical protein [Aquibacillus salsiterrae]|uniref:Uncharacterized protein n=1 Tax=Aquibacillus salsiterrae TaxID=2950439 RepID=A0A9X4AGJ0_9BACI|nr:hypothetical protein [Aquibacillus salsiterrae]MDC3418734.1 hypothetical protein [Aquibacillus salsiterrae]